MYVAVNGKLTKVTREEYERMVADGEAAKSPITKMDELINAVLSVEEAISGGGGSEDTNTTYTITIVDNTVTLTGSDGSIQNIDIPASVLSQSWDAEAKEYGLTVTNGETETTVPIQYHLIKNVEANQIVLMAGDKPVDVIQLAQDQDTKYTIEKVGNEIRLIPSDGSESIPIELDPDLNTTYELSFDANEDTLTLTPNDNSLPQVVSLAKFADEEAVTEAFEQYDQEIAEINENKADKTELAPFATKEEVNTALAGKVDTATLENYAQKSEIPDVSGFATKTEVETALEEKANKNDVSGKADKTYVDEELAKKADATALDSLATKTELSDGLATKADKSEISDMVTTAALAVALETKADKSALNDYVTTTTFDTEIAKKANTTDIPDVSAFITEEALQPYATTEAMNSGLNTKANKANLINNSGAIYNKLTNDEGYDLLFNEAKSGGGAQEYNTKDNVISFVGVNHDAPNGINAQIYAKYIADKEGQTKNMGSRLNMNVNGFYYTTNKTNGSFEAGDELATKKDLPNLENYATNEDVDAVSTWATEELSSTNAALRAQIDILNKMIREIKYPEIENMDVDMDISASGKDIAISGTVSDVVRNITNANSVVSDDLVLENARVAISASEDVEISGMSTSGTLAKSVSNAAVSINNSGNVVIKESNIEQNSYNGFEVGLANGVAPKNVLIDNVQFTGKLTNNAISIFGHEVNAEIVISNCVFEDCSNPVRISNKTNVPAKIRFINCTVNKWETGDYQGFVLLQDYTSTSTEEAETANRFANLEITFENCTAPGGVKIVGTDGELCTKENQIVYLYRDKGGLVAYDAAKFPKMSAF